MRLLTKISVTLAFCFADAFFGFAFYFRWNKYGLFAKDVIHYSFAHSMFELWLFSALRVVALMGALVILCDSKDGMSLIKTARYPVGFVNIFMVIITLAKIMLYTEFLDGDHDDDVWFLSLGAWTMVASLAMYALWVYILQEAGPTDSGATELNRMPLNKKEKWVKIRNASTRSDSHTDDSDDADIDDDDDVGDDTIDDRRDKERKPVEEYSTLRLLSYTAPDWPLLLVAFAALIAATVGKVFLPKLIGHVLDGIVIKESKDKPNSQEPIIYMTLISIGIAVTNGVRSGFFTLTTARLNRRITKSLFDSIVTQELGFFDKNTTGTITSCLIADIATMSDMLGIKINICLQSIFELIGNLIFMVLISWRLTIITVVTFPLLSIIGDVFGSYYKNLSSIIQSTLATANTVAGEAISNMNTVRSFANEKGEKKSYGIKLKMTYLLRRKGAVAAAVAKVFSSMFTLMMFVGTLFYGGHLVRRKMITGGMLVSYILYHQAFGACLETLAGIFADLMKATGASRKVLKLINRTPKVRNEGRLAPRIFKGHLEFKNVSFAYPTEPSIPVLNDVSFQAYPGEVLALVGPSGGGKSSCISLIEHFYEPTSGEVLIDGRNVQDYDHSYLHEKVSLVGQEPVLYARSINDNISYSLNNCSTERIQKAAKQANAHKFIMRLKKGYQTQAGEKGLQLSGGQKQRVAIARALVRNPQILLLDEATSALDAQSEYQVQQALTKNFGNRTVIIVAHRLSTIEKADRIVVIDQGKVVEQGRHQDLIRSDGLYAALVRRQLRGREKDEEDVEAEVERGEE